MEGISDEDSIIELYCEEAEDPPSTLCSDSKSDCHQTDASDKVPCPPSKTTVYHVSSQLVSLPLDTPAGEEESYIVINCRQEENMQDTMDTNSSTPGAQNVIHVDEELKNERISQPVVTSAHTIRSCLNNPERVWDDHGPTMEGISDEDSVVMLCCEEAEDTASSPWSDSKSDCHQTDASDKVPCPSSKTTVSHVSSQLVSPAGEKEINIGINHRDGENVQDTMDTNSSTPGAQNVIHVDEELKTERISQPVVTSAHTIRSCLNNLARVWDDHGPTTEGISDEDSVVMLCCEEAEDSPSSPWSDSKSDCHQTDASDKVPCPPSKTTVSHVSSQLVSPAGEKEINIGINRRDGENVQDTMDTNSSMPGAQNVIRVDEELKTERISQPVVTSAHTSE
ncbi:hypothetical protein ABVT39_015758 [Epinephelus coioides]